MSNLVRSIIISFFILSVSSAHAYQSPFAVSWETGKIRVGIGREARTDIVIRVPAGHFLYKDKTDLSFTALEGVHVKSIEYPDGVLHTDPVTGKKVKIYPEGEAVISVLFYVPKELAKGEKEAAAILEFQGCEEKLCLRPEEHLIRWKIDPLPSEAVTGDVRDAILEGKRPSIGSLLKVKDFSDVISRGRHIALLVAFIAGLLTSLTPCVWPMIPVMLLIIGVHKKGHFLGNLGLSLCLVLGITLTYSLLGAAASAAGSQMGFLFQQKLFLIAVVVFLFAMSLSMFGLFTIRLPSGLQNALTRIGGRGYRGAFLSGMSLGLLATPCVGPLLGPMLLWVAAQREYIFGAQLLAVYAFGIGVFYILAGTFYGTLAVRLKNVRAGNLVKKILGALLLIPAFYYLNSIVPIGGVFRNGIEWRHSEPAAIIEAVSLDRPLMIVFGARWCPPCLELERNIMNKAVVIEASKNLIPLHIDATVDSDEIDDILDKYGVVGWPTILFVAPDGKIYDDLKVVGDVPSAEELAGLMEEAARRR